MTPSTCHVCGKRHVSHRWPNPAREVAEAKCLDCHGPLESLGNYQFRCAVCHVKHTHGYQTFARSKTLINSLWGVVTDYSDRCVLSRFVVPGKSGASTAPGAE